MAFWKDNKSPELINIAYIYFIEDMNGYTESAIFIKKLNYAYKNDG
jgi:hypothetical protein